jgi:uncharacterized protein (TIGR03083 family)
MSDVETSVDALVAVLRASAERLAAALSPLSDEQLNSRSYCRDWSVAQVASHLGSGAEIFGRFLESGTGQGSAESVDFQAVWDVWNAKSPRAQADDVVRADQAFLNGVTAMDAETRQRWELDRFGGRHDLASVLRMRIGEHAVHTWDVAVAFDPSATIASDATEIIIDNLAGLVGRSGKSDAGLPPVHVVTSDPTRSFVLELDGEPARLRPAADEPSAQARLHLPAEAFIRLIYGRLDAGHTPQETNAEGIDLDALRRAFPGF